MEKKEGQLCGMLRSALSRRVPPSTAALGIPMRYLLRALISGSLFLLCHWGFFPSFLFALQRFAGLHWDSGQLGLEQTLCAMAGELGKGCASASVLLPKHPGSERELCATCHHHKGLFREGVRGFSRLLPGEAMCCRQVCTRTRSVTLAEFAPFTAASCH